MILLLIGPLFGGIVCAISAWAIVLSCVKRSCVSLGLCAGVLSLCWALSLPIVSSIGYNSELDLNRVLENINNYSFTPKGEEYIVRQLKKEPHDPLLLFSLGQLMQQRGKIVEAFQAYQEVVGSPETGPRLRQAAKINIAGILLMQGEAERAREMFLKLEKRGLKSFELLYNSALTYLALLDTQKHGQYYGRARELDEQRLRRVEARPNAHQKPLLAVLPHGEYGPLLLRSIGDHDVRALDRSFALQDEVAEELFVFGRGAGLIVFSLVVLVLGVIVRFGRPSKRALLDDADSGQSRSAIWLFIPGGVYFSGDRPVQGLCLLSVFVALVTASAGAPLSFFDVLPVEVSFHFVFGVFTVCFMLLCSVVAYVSVRQGAVRRETA